MSDPTDSKPFRRKAEAPLYQPHQRIDYSSSESEGETDVRRGGITASARRAQDRTRASSSRPVTGSSTSGRTSDITSSSAAVNRVATSSSAGRGSSTERQKLSELAANPPVRKSSLGKINLKDVQSSPAQHHEIYSDESAPRGYSEQDDTRAERSLDVQKTGGGVPEVTAPKPVSRRLVKDTMEWQLEQGKQRYNYEKDRSDEHTLSGAATQVYIVSYLIFFSILGTLARLGTQWLTFYPGAPVEIGNLWANFGGTLFMGFLSEDQRIFRHEWGRRQLSDQKSHDRAAHGKVKKTIPLFIGLATGFCGSYTSFSTFMRDVFLALANSLPTPQNHPGEVASLASTTSRNRGYSFLAVLAILILTLTVNISALKVGAHIALVLDPVMPSLPFRPVRKFVDKFVVFLAAGCWLGAVFMAIWPPDRPDGPSSRGPWSRETWRGEVIFALVFAPLGCLLRFYLSLLLNPMIPSFPLGTFTANIFGTAVLSMAYDLQHAPLGSASGLVGGGRVGCQVLQGIQDGFDGCLTTVSTWILELTTLRNRHSYTYGAMSIGLGLCIVVVIMGSVRWTIGFDSPACVITTS